jgi:pimeloyl-ACP methyl ester carboxylesterase
MQLETHCIERAGHWLHAEFPEEFASTVSDFLS